MKKVIVASLLSLGLMLGIFGFQQISSAAGTNTNYYFSFNDNTSTPARFKSTTSSVYIRATNMVGGSAFTAHVTLENGTRIGASKAVYQNQDTYLSNSAVETYKNGVLVRIKATADGGPQNASGYWRPDL